MSATKLSVNIDHVATLRQARGTTYPDPVKAARLAIEAGAAGITAHLRQDRRHIQDHDIARLREAIDAKINVEVSVEPGMLEVVLASRPDQVTLVPERAEEVTTEGGLDVVGMGSALLPVLERLRRADIQVSIFVDPDRRQIERLAAEAAELVSGYELNTDAYTLAPAELAAEELRKVRAAAELGSELGLAVYAGHGLTHRNVGPVSAIAVIEELNIGHSLVSRSVYLGMRGAVEEMLRAMRSESS